MSNIIYDIVLDQLYHQRADLGFYLEALRDGLTSSPPPYSFHLFSNEYRAMVRDPSWFAGLLVSDADLEGYSAKQLWCWAHRIDDIDFSIGAKKHAKDEARHSRMFAHLLFSLFPETDTTANRGRLQAMSPKLNSDPPNKLPAQTFEDSLQSAILVNLYEIKALVLGKLLKPTVAAYSTCDRIQRHDAITTALLADEVTHIQYTATFIERANRSGYGKIIRDSMIEHQNALNRRTLDDLHDMHKSATNTIP